MLTRKSFEQKLQREGWASFDRGHADLHIGLTDEEMATRLLRKKEQKSDRIHPVSTFATRADADFAIIRAMIVNSADILDWADMARVGQTYTCCVFLGDTIGRGFAVNLDEKISPVASVVLEKDNYSVNGFYVLTAYPDLDSVYAEKTGRTALEVVQRTALFQEATPLKKTYLLFADRNDLHLRYNAASSRGPECLTGWFNDGPVHYSILINRQTCNIRKRNNRMYTPEVTVRKSSLYLSNNGRYKSIKAVTDYLDAEQRKQFRMVYPQVGKQLDSVIASRDDYSI